MHTPSDHRLWEIVVSFGQHPALVSILRKPFAAAFGWEVSVRSGWSLLGNVGTKNAEFWLRKLFSFILCISGTLALCLLALFAVGRALTPSTLLGVHDLERLQNIFSSASPYGTDLQKMYYSLQGFAVLAEANPKATVRNAIR